MPCTFLRCPQVDKLEEAESQRQTEEEVTEPQPMVFGRLSCSVGAMKLTVKQSSAALKIALVVHNVCMYIYICLHHRSQNYND